MAARKRSTKRTPPKQEAVKPNISGSPIPNCGPVEVRVVEGNQKLNAIVSLADAISDLAAALRQQTVNVSVSNCHIVADPSVNNGAAVRIN